MDLRKLMEKKIELIEKNYPVSTWKVGNVDVWPLIRHDIGMKISTSKVEISKVLPKTEQVKEEFEIIKALDNEIDVFFYYDSISKVKLGNKWFSKLTDPIYNELKLIDLKVANLELCSHGIYRKESYNSFHTIQSELDSCTEPEFISTIALPEYDKVSQIINLELVKVNMKMLNKIQVYEKALNIERKALYLYKLFKKKKTKMVFLVNYYCEDGMACILAARMANVISVDIEHGVQDHFFYHKWLNLSEEGYNTLPNVFWNWHVNSSKKINEWAKKNKFHKSVVGRNNWNDLWQESKHEIIKNEINNLKQYFNPSYKNILITLQPLYGSIGWDKNIPGYILNIIKKSPENWKFYVRYHPGMLGRFKNELIECENLLSEYIKIGKVETDVSTVRPLPAILNFTDLHITASSTCVTEALNYGVPSIVLHPLAKELFGSYIKSGKVFYANCEEAVLKTIYHLLSEGNDKKNVITDIDKKSIVETYSNIINYFSWLIDFKSAEIIDDKKEISLQESELIRLIGKNDILKINFFVKLYKKGDFEYILSLIKNVEMCLDLYYILGRIYHNNKDYIRAIANLKVFIEYFNKETDSYFNEKNFLISANYYIGLSYYDLFDYKNAKKYFKKCVHLSSKKHNKALQYLMTIDKKRIKALDDF